MAYKCSFMDNSMYLAQDVNEMFSHLTSGSVVFSDIGRYLICGRGDIKGKLHTISSLA